MTATEVVSTITGAFSGLLSGAASSIVSLFQVLFMNATVVEGVTTYSGISDFGTWILTFFGAGIGIGILSRISRKVVK